MNGRSAPTLLWHTYPLGLLAEDQSGKDRGGQQTLRDLVGWLPHVASLGGDALLLGPVFASLSHGYDTVTHHDVDDRLGTCADLDALIAAARREGVGVVLDGAFAYASRAFWRLDDSSESRDPWFRRDAQGQLVPWRVDALITPNYDSAAYQSYVVEVMSSWLDRGVAGWRLDSAWTVPVPFWRRVLTRVRRAHPDAWFLAQVFDDDLPAVIDRAGYSSATEYALMHGTREWLSGGPVQGMVATLRTHAKNCTLNPVNSFLGNHDVARLADTVDTDLLAAAFAVLLTVPGVPTVYYGDEIALTSQWAQGGSDAALRPSMRPEVMTHQVGPAAELLATVRRLGQFRRERPWLTHGSVEMVRAQHGALAYRTAGHHGDAVDVYLNPTGLPVAISGPGGIPVLGTTTRVTEAIVEVPPRSWAILAQGG